MSYYNSELDAFTLFQHNDNNHDLQHLHHSPHRHHGPHAPHMSHPPYHHRPHASDILPSSETTNEAALPALGHAVSGSISSAIASLAIYPLDVVVKRLQAQKALSRRPESRIERDKRLERERLDRAKEDELLAFGNEEELEKEQLRKDRRSRREKEKRDRKEKGKGMVFNGDITNGRAHPLGRHASEDGGLRAGTESAIPTGTGLGVYSAVAGGRLAESVTQQILEDKAQGRFEDSDYETHGEPDPHGHDQPIINGILEETEFKRRPRFKTVEGYEGYEGYYEEGDEVEVDENYKGVIDAFGKIMEKEGVRGFYTGVVEDTVNTTVNGLWYFATYSFLRHQRLKQLPPNTTTLPVLEELSVGIIAGAISKFFTTPIANVVTRKQTAVFHAREHRCRHHIDKKRHEKWCPHNKRPTILSIIQDIYEEHGAFGFWAGYKPTLLLTLNPAITFLLYEMLKKGLPKKYREQTKTQTFLLGALAKAVASTVTYPLAVMKTRSMIKSKKALEASIRSQRRNVSTDSSSSNGDSSTSSDSSSDSGIESDVGLKNYKLKYKMKYKKKYGRFNNGRDDNVGMRAVAKEIYKSEGFRGFYVGLWAEVLRGFFANGISMLIKETIFHTLTSMYLLVLRARNRTDDKSFAGTLVAIGQEIHETLYSKHQHFVDGMKRDAEDLIERGKERWHLGREKIIRGVTGGAGGTAGGVYHNGSPEEEVITKTTTTTVTEEIRKPVKRSLLDNANSTVNVSVGHNSPPRRLERSNGTSAEMMKRKMQLRDTRRDHIHEGAIHDGTHGFGHNHNHNSTLVNVNTAAATMGDISGLVTSHVSTADKLTVPSINSRERVATWLQNTQKEGTVPTLPLPPANLPPPPPPPPVSALRLPTPPGPGSFHLRTPANTPFSQQGPGSLVESMNEKALNGNGLRTGTFDVTKSRNIMREVITERNGTPLKKREHIDWEEDDLDWMRRR